MSNKVILILIHNILECIKRMVCGHCFVQYRGSCKIGVVHLKLIFSNVIHLILTQFICIQSSIFLVITNTLNSYYSARQFGKIVTFVKTSQKCLNTELILSWPSPSGLERMNGWGSFDLVLKNCNINILASALLTIWKI